MVVREQTLFVCDDYQTLSLDDKKSLIHALLELPDDAVLMFRVLEDSTNLNPYDYNNDETSKKIEIFCSRKVLETDEEYGLRLQKHNRNLARYHRELARFVKKSAEWEAWFPNKEALEREDRKYREKELLRLQKQADRASQQLFEAQSALKKLQQTDSRPNDDGRVEMLMDREVSDGT